MNWSTALNCRPCGPDCHQALNDRRAAVRCRQRKRNPDPCAWPRISSMPSLPARMRRRWIASRLRHRGRQRPVAILELLAQTVAAGRVAQARDPPVQVHLLLGVAHVVIGQVGRQPQFHFHVERGNTAAALKFRHRLLQQPAVEVEADGLHVAVLLLAQQVAGAADLQVAHGDVVARAQGLELLQRRQAAARLGGQPLARRGHQVGEGPVVAAADPPAQLVELGQSEAVGAVDDDGVDPRHVQARLDDRRGHQHVELVVQEGRS